MNNYVYCVVNNGIVVYIGKGKTGRISHINSGTSHNYKLNEYHFRNKLLGEPLPETRILNYYTSDKEATEVESHLIKLFKPECNIMLASDKTLKLEYFILDNFKDNIHLLESKVEDYINGLPV